MSTYRVLRKAQELIKKGWTQGLSQERTPDGVSYCTIGAISMASFSLGGFYYSDEAFAVACTVLRNVIEPDTEIPLSLATWNDDKTRTKEQVVEAFGAAVERARQQLPWWQRVFTTSE